VAGADVISPNKQFGSKVPQTGVSHLRSVCFSCRTLKKEARRSIFSEHSLRPETSFRFSPPTVIFAEPMREAFTGS
jgi:hypothetical protein